MNIFLLDTKDKGFYTRLSIHRSIMITGEDDITGHYLGVVYYYNDYGWENRAQVTSEKYGIRLEVRNV